MKVGKWLCIASFGCFVACSPGPKPQFLMPSPVVFIDRQDTAFADVPERQRSTELDVIYATNRGRQMPDYGAREEDKLKLGQATVHFGETGRSWEDLLLASTSNLRPDAVPVKLKGFEELGVAGENIGVSRWIERVDQEVAQSATGEAVIYVHGAKVGFLHACAFAAEIDHFCGRIFVPIAFDWPTHREIFSYVDGVDVRHARQSAGKLAEMIRLLAERSRVRKIHIVSWSAGARVLSRAMEQLDADGFRSRKVGTLVFAASDVPRKDFMQRADAIHRQSERVVVYVSDADFALKWSGRLMGGGDRLGLEPEKVTEDEVRLLRRLPRLEVVDTSLGKTKRGFDIGGHRYWFQHPWVNSDLVLTLAKGLAPKDRGLSRGKLPKVWYFGQDYEKQVRNKVKF